jgi:hypothetical protein
MAIQLNDETLEAFQDSMRVAGTIELPFAVPYLWVINGDVKLEAVGGAQYFGGWSTDAQKMIEAGQDYGKDTAPAGWIRQQVISSTGQRVDSFLSRSAIVAPIDFRRSWFWKGDGGLVQRSPDYFQGSRQHVQALVYLAGKSNGSINPWGPAVISAKGFQANNLLKSFETWNKATASIRKQVAPGVPAWFFYLAIGTFGTERHDRMVGPTGKQSGITPIGPYIPETITADQMESLFVGQEIANDMVIIKREAQEWLKAWGTPSPRGPAQASPAAPIIEEAYPVPPEEPPLPDDGDVPF